MKIVILVEKFPPAKLGGTEIASYHIADHLAELGNSVHVITSYDDGIPVYYKERNFFVHRVKYYRIPLLGSYLFWLLSSIKIREIKPDIIHAQIIGNAIPAIISKFLFRFPYVVHGRGSDVYGTWRGKYIISKLILEHADAVLAQTEHMKTEMEKIYSRKDIQIIPNGHDVEIRFNNSRIKQKDNEFAILYAGSLRPVKGVKYLILAIKYVIEKKIDVKLIILGDGEERVYLEELVKKKDLSDNISFLGYRPHDEVIEFMRNSDIFVLPSLSEGFPNVLLEAMATGSSIIATNVTGVSEIVRDGENGFLVNPGNSEEMGEKIIFLYHNEEIRSKRSNKSLKTAEEYLWINVVKKLEGIYLKVINK